MAAGSAQAKGRVERNHGTHQDRLIKKMRRKRIATHEAANGYLEQEYLPEHNRRFARPAEAAADYHRARPTKRELDEIFRKETEHSLGNNWVVRHDNRFFQVKRESAYAPAGSNVMVCEWEDGDWRFAIGGGDWRIRRSRVDRRRSRRRRRRSIVITAEKRRLPITLGGKGMKPCERERRRARGEQRWK